MKPAHKIPGIIHIILLIAKRCILKCWLLPSAHTFSMIIDQLKIYLHFDKIDKECHGDIKTEAFFDKWKVFLTSHTEINDLLRAFWYTEWYTLESLRGT